MGGEYDIGLIGLAVMGQNLALNIARQGYKVAVYNRTAQKTADFLAGSGRDSGIAGAHTIEELAAMLSTPRKVVLMVKAGQPVDEMIDRLLPFLRAGDIIMDGGNSYFLDTARRCRQTAARGIHYLGVGISGGEEGALHGPSLMVGGSPEAYQAVAPLLQQIAAQVDGESCCAYFGPDGAGHYIKMVHNGIEYADMELIAETYHIMQRGLALPTSRMSEVFAAWNEGELASYLLAITSRILARQDEDGEPLLDMILDMAEQKGTGKWASQNALDLGVPVPTITAAVDARFMSALKDERLMAAKVLGDATTVYSGDQEAFLTALGDALYAAKLCCYAQGFALLQAAGQAYRWRLPYAAIAKVWRGGCIIRAALLQNIVAAYQRPDTPANLLLDPVFCTALAARVPQWRQVVATAKTLGLPVPAFSTALDYYDSYRQARLPANLIQAQRDYFGAHTYRRVDQPGVFHTDWLEKEQ